MAWGFCFAFLSFCFLCFSPPLVASKKLIKTDVVVIGAGYAGLTVARRLNQNNLSVHVLEASNATGGRTKNYCLREMKPNIQSDYVVELGGQWIGNETVQPHAWKLIVGELGFQVFDGSYTPSGSNASNVLHASNGIHNFTELIDAFHQLPKNVQTELQQAWDELDCLAAKIDLTEPYTLPEARQWDSQTFTTWINNTVKLPESRTVLNVLCTSMIAQSPDVVSFLHILFYIKASDGMTNMVVNEQQYRIVGGSQAPTFKMASELGPGHVLLSTPVRTITQVEGVKCTGHNDRFTCYDTTNTTDPGYVLVDTDTDVSVQARYAVVTGAPPTTGRGIRFIPPLPYEKNQLFQRMPMGNSVKAQIVYSTAFWRENGYTGTILASVPPFGQPRDPLLSNCFDNTPYAGSPGVILCFVEGVTSFQMMQWSHEERIRWITEWLSESLGPKAKDTDRILTMLDFNWAGEPFIGGAYSSYLTPGVWTELGYALREPYGLIHWAGSDYAEDGFGYINGAIQSAEYTASEVIKLAKQQ